MKKKGIIISAIPIGIIILILGLFKIYDSFFTNAEKNIFNALMDLQNDNYVFKESKYKEDTITNGKYVVKVKIPKGSKIVKGNKDTTKYYSINFAAVTIHINPAGGETKNVINRIKKFETNVLSTFSDFSNNNPITSFNVGGKTFYITMKVKDAITFTTPILDDCSLNIIISNGKYINASQLVGIFNYIVE